jgi:hypothetical protein
MNRLSTYSREVDTARFQVQVHEIKRNPTLEITLDTIDSDCLSHVDDAAETEIWLGDCLVDPFIGVNSATEIPLGLFSRHALVIGVTRLNLERDIRSDDGGIVAT